MDCEGFDDVVLDLVYDEPETPLLEEARRHAGGCARCKTSLDSLQQTRLLTELPPLPVPAGLERSILEEVDRRRQEREATWWGRLDRAISLLGSFAMRPQTAMGALLVLMTGLSLVLLRAKPTRQGTVRITEDGVPAAEPPAQAVASVALAAERRPADLPAPRPREEERSAKQDAPPEAKAAPREAPPEAAAVATIAAAPAASAALPGAPGPASPHQDAEKSSDKASDTGPEAAFSSAMEHYKARRYAEAARAFDVVANGGGDNGTRAALYAARATRYSSGCQAALPRFNAIANRQVGTSAAAEATWEAALCYREAGQTEQARQLLGTLRRVAGYRDRVEKELEALESRGSGKEPAAAKPGGR
jgi:TolA-binding protein